MISPRPEADRRSDLAADEPDDEWKEAQQAWNDSEGAPTSPDSSSEWNQSGETGAAHCADDPKRCRAQANACRTCGGSLVRYPRLTWVMFFMATLLVGRYFGPQLAREISYGVTQGKQRAEYEFATVALDDMPLANLSRAYQMVSKRVAPSVVHINIAGVTENVHADAAPLFGPRMRSESRGQGSGVIVDRDGYVLTNEHVIEGAESITVLLSDGRRVSGEVVGVDPLTDLALLKISADNLLPAEWGSSDELQVGSLVLAVGSPFGLEQSVTSGIVSAKNRAGKAGRTYQDFLQTDAAVNPGNSGGPLVDTTGKLVGINTAIVGESYRGVSFAIPSNVARNVYERLKRDGEVARGWLGVQLVDIDETEAVRLGVEPQPGAYVSGFVDSTASPSPARRSGLEIADIVIRWNGKEVVDRNSLSRYVAETDVDSVADVVVLRSGREVSLQIKLGRRPAQFN